MKWKVRQDYQDEDVKLDGYAIAIREEGEPLESFLLSAARRYRRYLKQGGKHCLEIRKPEEMPKLWWPGIKDAMFIECHRTERPSYRLLLKHVRGGVRSAQYSRLSEEQKNSLIGMPRVKIEQAISAYSKAA